jgi:acyl-coenzyme A thioesterase PaaI-like protein
MVARGRVQRRTRRLCFTAASIEQQDGTVVAEARALLAYVAI